LTFKAIDAETPEKVAVIVVVPTERAVISPCDPNVLLMFAIVVSEELQPAWVVKSCELPSVKVPIALNWTINPLGVEGYGAVTDMDVTRAGLTVNAGDFETPAKVAVIEAIPAETAVICPWDPIVLLTIAIVVSEELHTVWSVKFCELPSEKVPVAINWTISPLGIGG